MKPTLFWSIMIIVMSVVNNLDGMDTPSAQKIVGWTFVGAGSIGIATGLCHAFIHSIALSMFPSLMKSEHRKETIQSLIKKVGIPLSIGFIMVGSGIYLAREQEPDDI